MAVVAIDNGDAFTATAIAVSREGASSSIPCLAEVEAFAKSQG